MKNFQFFSIFKKIQPEYVFLTFEFPFLPLRKFSILKKIQAEYVFLTFENWRYKLFGIAKFAKFTNTLKKNALFLQFHFRPILGHLKIFFRFFPQISKKKKKYFLNKPIVLFRRIGNTFVTQILFSLKKLDFFDQNILGQF